MQLTKYLPILALLNPILAYYSDYDDEFELSRRSDDDLLELLYQRDLIDDAINTLVARADDSFYEGAEFIGLRQRSPVPQRQMMQTSCGPKPMGWKGVCPMRNRNTGGSSSPLASLGGLGSAKPASKSG